MVWLFLIPIVFFVLGCCTMDEDRFEIFFGSLVLGFIVGLLVATIIGFGLPTCTRITATKLKTFSKIPGNYYVIDENVRGKTGGAIKVSDGKSLIDISSYNEKENTKPELIKKDNPFKHEWYKWIGFNVKYGEEREANIPKGTVFFLFD